MITENEYLKAKETIERYEKQQLELKELMSKDTLTIQIRGCLYPNGNRPYIPEAKDRRLRIEKQGERFSTISELKDFYMIKKVEKTGEKEFAISPKGKRHEWDILQAEVSMSFIKTEK